MCKVANFLRAKDTKGVVKFKTNPLFITILKKINAK